jgi:hypothetical protein
MKKMNRITQMLFLSLLSLTLLFSACSNDDELTTKTDLLTSSSWKVTALTVDPAFPTFDNEGNVTGSTNDLFAMMDDCSKDDTYSFNTDKTLILDEGASKCYNAAPQKTTGSWSFNSDETTLTITVDGDPQTMTIVELTDKAIKLKVTESQGGVSFSITTTFSH